MPRHSSVATLTVLFLLAPAGMALALEGSGKDWGARDPGACPSVQLEAAPTPEQVIGMLRCKHDVALATGELWLMENIKVQVGTAGTPFVEAYGTYVMEDGDVNSTAYYLRGSFTWAVCKTRADASINNGNPDLNCYESDVPVADGVCWKTSFADWRCRIKGAASGRREPTSPPQ